MTPATPEATEGQMSDQAANNDMTDIERENEHLRHEIDMLTKGGVIEVAVRNPSVMEYMRHWEARAEKAEAALAARSHADIEAGEPAGDAVEIALRRAASLLSDLALGRSIQNDRFPHNKVEGPLWDKVSDVVKALR